MGKRKPRGISNSKEEKRQGSEIKGDISKELRGKDDDDIVVGAEQSAEKQDDEPSSVPRPQDEEEERAPTAVESTEIISLEDRKLAANVGQASDSKRNADGRDDDQQEDDRSEDGENGQETAELLDSVMDKSSNEESAQKHERKRSRRGGKPGNALTTVVPGYTAPMKLDSKSLDRIRPEGGLQGMRQKAALEESQKGLRFAKLMAQSSSGNAAPFGGISQTYRATFAALTVSKKQRRKANAAKASTTAGEGWFHMRPSPMTEEVKQDIQLIKNRNYLDPKRFYKSAEQVGNNNNKRGMVQLGTVVEGATEFYRSRLTKKQRRSNLTEEIMADPAVAAYAYNKFQKMQAEKADKFQRWKKHNPKARTKDYRKPKK